jgi:thioesterase domain-containing protein
MNESPISKQHLEQRIRQGIPISNQMDFHVLELSPTRIKVSGGAQQNINVHGTAFAGSLYTLCTLAVWALLYSRLPGGTSLVMAKADISYRKPVIGDIVSQCEISESKLDRFLQILHDRYKARIQASAQVICDKNIAAELNATMFAQLASV